VEKSNLVEKWSRWEPITGLTARYYVDGVVDTIDELIVRLVSDQDQSIGVEVVFDSAWAYRLTNESFRLSLIYQLGLKYGEDFYTKWAFFKVDESDYLDWLSR
jgi:hypothetical protein